MNTLTKELLMKIDEHRRHMFHERIEEFEKASEFAIDVRVDPGKYTLGSTKIRNVSFANYCFNRRYIREEAYIRNTIGYYLSAFVNIHKTPEELNAIALLYSPEDGDKITFGSTYKPSLPREVELKIHGYRIQAFNKRIKEFEKTSEFAMSVRYDQSTYTKYMTVDIPDFNRDSFILHCMRRSFGSVSDWRPGPDDVVDVDYMKYSEEYKGFLLMMCIKYLMSDVMIARASIKLEAHLAGGIDTEGLALSSDDDVFDGYDEYSSD